MKLLLDKTLSILLIMLLSPIIVTLVVLIRIKLGNPVLFSQIRPGLKGKPFKINKFRTMKNTVDNNGDLLPDTQRITRFGSFLRSSSLDELPELWNVLKGEMSLVGPRPLLMEYLPLYNDEQMYRHNMLPGITGWAQVNGRNSLSWEEKFKLDLWYINNQSLWLDCKILLMTLKKVLTRDGITAEGHVTAEKFKGNKS